MMGKVLEAAGGTLSLADFPKAVIARIQAAYEPDYSFDASWVSHCLDYGTLPASSLAGQAMASGKSPFAYVRRGGGLVT